MITARDITFTHGAGPVYDKASFVVGKDQKVGLVGPNGAGKSTLFNLITGTQELDEGDIDVAGSIGYVPQEVKRDKSLETATSIRHYLDPEQKNQQHELLRLLKGLEIAQTDLDVLPNNLSGGQKTKLALARALISEPDILLLDEPVNFMDTAGKKFVMNFLRSYPHALMVVSHDLDLLDKAIDKVLSINTQTNKIDTYTGTYKQAMSIKKEQEELLKRQIQIKKKHIEQMEQSMSKLYKFKSDKGIRARVQQQRRIDREKAALPDMPTETKAFKLEFGIPQRIGDVPILVKNICKSYGSNVILDDLSCSVYRDDTFVILGHNGAGKSTLLKIIMEKLSYDKGFFDIDQNAIVGYYSQEFESFDFDKRVLDTVMEECRMSEQRARAYLGGFMFGVDKIRQTVDTLSGGEKTRLSIAMIMARNNNLLILDEPTTYLDPVSQRVVLEALKQYKGTLVLVSHVEQFVSELKPTRALLMPEGKSVLWSEELLSRVSDI